MAAISSQSAMVARRMTAFSWAVRSEIGLVGLWNVDQALMEMVFVVFRAHGLQHRAFEFEPMLRHRQRGVVGVGIFDRRNRGKAVAIGADGEALDDVQLVRMRRTEIV